MNTIIPFPRKKQADAAGLTCKKNIEKRFGVSFWEYLDITPGTRTLEVEEKIKRSLHKETLQTATKTEEDGTNRES